MANLSPLMQQVLVMVMAAMLVAPGLVALYLGLHRDMAEKQQLLQVQSMAHEIQRLQVLTDDQAREIASLGVQVSKLEAMQQGWIDVAQRLEKQLLDNGHVPVINVKRMTAASRPDSGRGAK